MSNYSTSTNMNALSCVSQNDVVSLRIICTLSRNDEYNLEELDSCGNTALLKACYLGRFECAQTLLEFGADIYAINYFGQNALTLATYAGHFQLVRMLLQCRSYEDFNLSSLIPAICVAVMQKHKTIEDYFQHLEPESGQDIRTVHGLRAQDLRQMVNVKLKKSTKYLHHNII